MRKVGVLLRLPRQQSAVSQRRIATQDRAKSKQREINPVYYTLCPQLFRQRHQLDGLFFVTSIEFFCLWMQVLSLVFFVLKEVQARETKQKHKANSLLPFLCK